MRRPTDSSDRQLIGQARAGDQEAYTKLVNDWYMRMYNYAYRYSGHKDIAQDVVQQIFIHMYQHLGELKDLDRFRPWLYRIAANCCHSESRSRRARDRVETNGVEMPERVDTYTPVSEVEKKERKMLVRYLLQKIPADQRTVIIMKEYEGLKFREIAEALGASENTVKSRLYYGLEAMRKELKKMQWTESLQHG